MVGSSGQVGGEGLCGADLFFYQVLIYIGVLSRFLPIVCLRNGEKHNL